MTERSVRRAELIREMERLYTDRAYTDIELAERLDAHRTTIYRARRFMEDDLALPFIHEGDGRYRLDRKKQMTGIQLSQMEALALYLGGRRLQQQTRIAHRPTASALEKLAHVLRQPMMRNLVRAAQEVLEQESDQQQTDNLERIVEGWTNGRKLRVHYHKPHAPTRVYTISPYQLEPSIWSDGLYLIGHSDYHDQVITLKLSRIERVSVTTEPFTIPDTFDSYAMLEHAWGIWHGEGEADTVRLRFSPLVTPRVKESIWHPSQTIADRPDGGCEWSAEIAEWREMEPWVLGWGAQVEVLAPPELRESVAGKVRAAAGLYDSPADPMD